MVPFHLLLKPRTLLPSVVRHQRPNTIKTSCSVGGLKLNGCSGNNELFEDEHYCVNTITVTIRNFSLFADVTLQLQVLEMTTHPLC
jgi:hypothetical protein